MYIYVYKAGYLGARVRVHDGAHMRTLVADARVAMCPRINRTFAFPLSTVVPFYALPHCLASHAAHRKHSLTCSVFFPLFFFLSPHFVPLTPPPLHVFYAYGEFMSQHSDVIRSVRFYADDAASHQGTVDGKSFLDHDPFRIFSFTRNIPFNERGRKISCKFLFVDVNRVLRRG